MARSEDRESALRNLEEAARFWVETVRELGWAVPEPTPRAEASPPSETVHQESTEGHDVPTARTQELALIPLDPMNLWGTWPREEPLGELECEDGGTGVGYGQWVVSESGSAQQ